MANKKVIALLHIDAPSWFAWRGRRQVSVEIEQVNHCFRLHLTYDTPGAPFTSQESIDIGISDICCSHTYSSHTFDTLPQPVVLLRILQELCLRWNSSITGCESCRYVEERESTMLTEDISKRAQGMGLYKALGVAPLHKTKYAELMVIIDDTCVYWEPVTRAFVVFTPGEQLHTYSVPEICKGRTTRHFPIGPLELLATMRCVCYAFKLLGNGFGCGVCTHLDAFEEGTLRCREP